MFITFSKLKYCNNPFRRTRLKSTEVPVGDVGVGGSNPVRVQSMTTADTMDTKASVDEIITLINAGCEIVRLTAPSKKDAENLGVIKRELTNMGYSVPLVADIHFTPNAAEVAARIVEKVRINPGNFIDKKRFEEVSYTEESYKKELVKLESRLIPLIEICKAHKTSLRIGSNHGSLSDRITSQYGDSPEGMVRSAMEFVEICQKHDFHRIIISMKSSNTRVMVQAYRLLASVMIEEGRVYPLHLGVTEAGDGEDGRIKSCVGIGALLEDGIGDTVRVSLTEAAEKEIPVARTLIDKFKDNDNMLDLPVVKSHNLPFNPFQYSRRVSTSLGIIGGEKAPVVFGCLDAVENIKPSHLFGYGYKYSVPNDKWNVSDQAADFIYMGNSLLNFEVPPSLNIVHDFDVWKKHYSSKRGFLPLVQLSEINRMSKADVFIIEHEVSCFTVEYLKEFPNAIVKLVSNNNNFTQACRFFWLNIANSGVSNPIILSSDLNGSDEESELIWSSSKFGSLFIDGFGDGIWIKNNKFSPTFKNRLSFGILQATRTRISKTEYISCPSCGRTLFDLQDVTFKIKDRTDHLKGLKIGIMGCIVNGPGEMADADYGYVGSGPDKIHLYKGQNVIRKNVPDSEAVDALVQLIKENGDWQEKP